MTRVSLRLRAAGGNLGSERETIAADRSQVQRLVINLLTNALEALDGRGTIEIGTRTEQLSAEALASYQHADAARPGRYVVLHVADTGRGIDAASASRIFEPFFSTKFTGSGLGLATVLGVVQGHCGAVRVHSQPGAGTRFDVALPYVEAASAPRAHTRPPEPLRTAGAVLVIDDDARVSRVISQLLRRMGFEVTAADGGESGLLQLQPVPAAFDLVLLDWLMPGVCGEAVLRELRSRHPTLPVILMSGYSTQSLGSDDPYLARIQKPMTREQLEAAVRRVRDSAARRAG